MIQIDELISQSRDLRRRIARWLALKQESRGKSGYNGVFRFKTPIFELNRERAGRIDT